MKKVFLALLLFAGIATCFSGCKKDDDNGETPETPETPVTPPTQNTNAFCIGDDIYDVALAGLIENINVENMTINVVALASNSDLNSTNNNAICVIYYSGITTGTFDVAPAPLPRVVALKDFNLSELVENIAGILTSPNAYFAASGSLTLEISEEIYTIRANNILLSKSDGDPVSGIIDYQGPMTKIELSLGEGSFTYNNDTYQISEAGTLYYTYMGMTFHLMGFLSEDMTKLVAVSIGDSIPEGDFIIPTDGFPLIFMNDLDISTMQGTPIFASAGNISITKPNDLNYHVVISDVVLPDGQLNLEYTGTIPPVDL